MQYFYRRSGAITGFFIVVFLAIAAVEISAGGVQPLRVVGGLVIVVITAAGATFLAKSYIEARDAPFGGGALLVHAAAAFAAAIVSWFGAFAMFHEASPFIADLSGPAPFLFIVEQIAAGALFDLLESYKIRLTDLDYPAGDYVAATAVFGMRLTGSVIVAALFIRAITQPEKG